MQMWCLIACGRVAEDAQEELSRQLRELLATPEFGCDHSQLVIGSGPAASGLHEHGGERVPEPAGA